MTRLATASIRLVQKKNRRMKDGTYPIYIVICFNGRVEKVTGVSCSERDWNPLKEEVRKSCPNAPVLNKILSDIKQRCIDRKMEYELAGKVYSPSMLLKDSVIDHRPSNSFKGVMDDLLAYRRLKHKTCCKYKYAYNKLTEFLGKDNFIIEELDVGTVKDFCRWLTVNDSTKRDICSCIASVWNYAIDKRIVTGDDYPFRTFKFATMFKTGQRTYYLEKVHMKMLYEYFMDLVIVQNGNRWTYKDNAFERLRKRTSEEFSILWFLLCYKFNGSAPVEITMLKGINCKRISIDGVDYWAIDFKRQKTNVDVHVRLKRDIFCQIALEHFIGTSTNGYIYPIIRHLDKDLLRQGWKASETCIKKVRDAFKVINDEIIRKNVNEDAGLPLVNVEDVQFYTARHSFAAHYINSPGSSVNGLASLLARGVNTIGTYVHQLTQDKEIAEAVEVLSF